MYWMLRSWLIWDIAPTPPIRKRFKEKGPVDRKPGSGGQNLKRTDDFAAGIQDKVEASPMTSMQSFAKEVNVSRGQSGGPSVTLGCPVVSVVMASYWQRSSKVRGRKRAPSCWTGSRRSNCPQLAFSSIRNSGLSTRPEMTGRWLTAQKRSLHESDQASILLDEHWGLSPVKGRGCHCSGSRSRSRSKLCKSSRPCQDANYQKQHISICQYRHMDTSVPRYLHLPTWGLERSWEGCFGKFCCEFCPNVLWICQILLRVLECWQPFLCAMWHQHNVASLCTLGSKLVKCS